MPVARLWLVRHGQSTWNLDGRWQGQADPPLSELGLRQAAAVAGRLATLGAAVIYTSDLARCRQTAEPLAAALGVVAKERADLREIDIGAWSGLTRAEIEATFPDEWARWRAGEDVARGGGESYGQLQARVLAAVAEITRAEDARAEVGEVGEVDAVVVTHGGCIRAIVTAALGLGVAVNAHLGGADNASVSALRPLRPPAGGFRVEHYNDVGHLDGLRSP